jgi:sn-glycerol 3-phosphate transport system ATP-binding protein
VRTETSNCLGAERLIYGRMAASRSSCGSRKASPAPAAEQVIRVKPREDRLHWFDARSGQRYRRMSA